MDDDNVADAGPSPSGGRRSKHPLAVVFPIAAWSASLGFDLLSLFGPPDNGFAARSRSAMLVGLAGAAVSGALGLRDLLRFSPGHRPTPLGLFHAALNVGAVGFYGAAALRRGAIATEGELDGDEGSALRDEAGRVPPGDVVAAALALGTLVLSGTAGGLLAKRFDVRPG